MGGCSSCHLEGGCDTRKGEERHLLGELLPRLYPERRWGAPDDAARFRAGVGEGEARRLTRRAQVALGAPTLYRPGDEGESCDYIYVLCVGRQPGLVELRDRDEPLAWPDGEHVRERYLRAALSQMARVAAVQEVAVELDREGDVYVVSERPRAGIFDPILLERAQKLIELIVGASITYLDFALIERPPEDFDGADYEARYGQPPGVVNYLFFPQPATAVSTVCLPAAAPLTP